MIGLYSIIDGKDINSIHCFKSIELVNISEILIIFLAYIFTMKKNNAILIIKYCY